MDEYGNDLTRGEIIGNCVGVLLIGAGVMGLFVWMEYLTGRL